MKNDINLLDKNMITKVKKVKKSKVKNVNDNKQLSKIEEVPERKSKYL